MSKKIDIAKAPTKVGSKYPPPFHETGMKKFRHKLGDAAGLTQFGVNILILEPGVWSSQRHWHTAEDEFVFVLEGEVVLITDAGEEVLKAGDCAGFKKGIADGHHLVNRSNAVVKLLEVGGRRPSADEVFYSDIDLHIPKGSSGYFRKDGTKY